MLDISKAQKRLGDQALRVAANAEAAAFEDSSVIGDSDIKFFRLKPVSIESICLGCTDPNSPNFNPYAEVDDASC